ncbi:MAG: D-alanyl-D-alanine carboxypeptidase, partial [Butyrivibrio sp.]|nr:D-alanyl-D-alanine carboxypeptidase [Butyrivibrio sp.]
MKNGLTKRHNKENESIEVEDSSAEVSSLGIVDTYTEEPEVIEEDTGFLDKSEDSALFFEGYEANVPSGVAYISSENVASTYAVLVNLENGNVVASKEGTVKIYPASMTKILTLLVAAEHIESLEDTFTMTQEIGDFVYTNDCSAVGFSVGETVTVQDLLYGTILPSGGDAAMCLAEYVAGSQEAFVEMM